MIENKENYKELKRLIRLYAEKDVKQQDQIEALQKLNHDQFQEIGRLEKELRKLIVPPKESKQCICCGDKPGIIGGYCVECNEIAYQERKETREKVSPPILGGGTPTQLEKSEVCSYCNGCGYVEDPCNHLAFFKLCPICKNSSILTVKKVKKLVTTETENIGNLKNEGGKD